MTKDMIWGVVRAVLAAVGGYFVGAGILEQSTVNDIIGALGIIFAAGCRENGAHDAPDHVLGHFFAPVLVPGYSFHGSW